MENAPFVSVIIPVYNDAAGLKSCLEALENQTYPKSHNEVIVVDNASHNSPEIEDIVRQYHQATYTYQTIPGSYAARNQGISIARGEIIAFTDADCIPYSNWLERGVNNLLNVPNCGLVAGKIDLFFQNPKSPTFVELYESITAFPQEKLLKNQKGGATANVFTFKEVINCVGDFNPTLKSNGDLEWGQRVFAKGYQQVYADDVCVAHRARSSLSQLYQRTIRLAGGIYDRHHVPTLSVSEKNILFIKDLAFHMMPPLMFVGNTFFNSPLENLTQKIQVSLTIFFVRYIMLWELCRLKLGGTSARE
jgi:glycosyltransferase involved in cell wall biosynthesis